MRVSPAWTTGSAVRYENQSSFIAPAGFTRYLKSRNITIASLANNHILDGGTTGILETERSLKESGIYYQGGGVNATEACQPLIVAVKGTRIGFLSYNMVNPGVISATRDHPGTGSSLVCNVTHSVRYLKERCDIVVVSVHWGRSWNETVDESQEEFVHELSDAGADLIVGHHPHVIQAIGISNTTLVVYSLGNFILNPEYEMPDAANNSLIILVSIRDGRVQNCHLYPLRLGDGGIPRMAKGEERESFISHLSAISAQYSVHIEYDNGLGVIHTINT